MSYVLRFPQGLYRLLDDELPLLELDESSAASVLAPFSSSPSSSSAGN
jgi:hypothetical protein